MSSTNLGNESVPRDLHCYHNQLANLGALPPFHGAPPSSPSPIPIPIPTGARLTLNSPSRLQAWSLAHPDLLVKEVS